VDLQIYSALDKALSVLDHPPIAALPEDLKQKLTGYVAEKAMIDIYRKHSGDQRVERREQHDQNDRYQPYQPAPPANGRRPDGRQDDRQHNGGRRETR
jgi:hypothetical protein